MIDTETFQYISDIHINQNNIVGDNIQTYIEPSADNLLIAGDIGNPFLNNYSEILKWCSDHFKNTYIIPGNHEYYCMISIHKVNLTIQNICEELENVYFLNNSAKYLNDICIIGTILWSDINLTYTNEIKSKVTNFKKIKSNDILITPSFVKNEYNSNLKWLESEIETASQMDNIKKIIILTHYPPLMNFRKHKNNYDKLKTAYCNNLNRMVKNLNEKVCLWVCGHTHYNTYVKYKNILVVSNCVGYIKNNIFNHKTNAIYVVEL